MIYLLTHNDMDGYGCRLVLEDKFTIDEVTHTDYAKISYYLNSIANREPGLLFITDLNFSTKDDFKALTNVCKAGWKVIFIDHHQYIESDYKILNALKEQYNLDYLINEKTCATGLCLIYTKNKKENLKKLVKFICAYDIWKRDTKEFEIGFMLNTIF
jgi:oligoribonuclease NrnB/cAMP/cGMP phosphodiesterase (DHH superfamily)